MTISNHASTMEFLEFVGRGGTTFSDLPLTVSVCAQVRSGQVGSGRVGSGRVGSVHCGVC